MNEGEYLFVYGTLRMDVGNPMRGLLARSATFIGAATFQGKLYLVDDYPGAVPSDDPDERVRGELYALSEPGAVLATLDEYEDYDPRSPETSLYLRERADITRAADGRSVSAWIYLYNQSVEKLELIPSGDYGQGE